MESTCIGLAQQQDVTALVSLINRAYRSDFGWTHEHEIVAGDRISAAQLTEQLTQVNFNLLVLHDDQNIVGCIGLTHADTWAEIGSFAVDPMAQNRGYGQRLLFEAEQYAQHTLGKTEVRMSVLHVREELLAYYLRRGYQETDEIEAYPLDAQVGQPLMPLHLVVLKKSLELNAC